VSAFAIPGGRRGCCGIAVRGTHVVPASGRLRITFRWPSRYYECVRDHGKTCVRRSWRNGQVARIGVDAPEMHPFLRGEVALNPPVFKTVRVRGVSKKTRTVAAAEGPVDPVPATGIPYHPCDNPWMTSAGSVGAGIGADVSFAPTDRARYLGRFNPEAVWASLQGCEPLPYLTNDEYNSMYQQLVCHLEGGVAHFGGSTFDFEAWRPEVPAFTSLVTAHCNPTRGDGAGVEYLDDIIQWSGDSSAQKAAWLVVRNAAGTLERRWIPTSEIYYCLRNAGHDGPIVLDHSYIATYLTPTGDPVGRDEACGAAPPQTNPGGNDTPPPPPPTTHSETTGGETHTWTNYNNAGGDQGPVIAANQTVEVACKVRGFVVADGDPWWYRIASAPWNSTYYASADAFYNNGQTSGSLHGTPFVDGAVPDC
jgi:hypothetical protein